MKCLNLDKWDAAWLPRQEDCRHWFISTLQPARDGVASGTCAMLQGQLRLLFACAEVAPLGVAACELDDDINSAAQCVVMVKRMAGHTGRVWCLVPFEA